MPEFLIAGFGEFYGEFDGPFRGEPQAWASQALKLSFGEVVLANCGYELDRLEHRKPLSDLRKIVGPFNCATGICEMTDYGMAHLDWVRRK